MFYARVVEGRVCEIIPPVYDEEGVFIPVELRYTSEFVETLVQIDDPTVVEGYSYEDGVFNPPKVYLPTQQEVFNRNKQYQEMLLSASALKLAPLQYAVDLEMATAEESALLLSWKRYSVYVNRVDLTKISPEWPTQP